MFSSAMQADDKLVVGGLNSSEDNYGLILSRHNKDGSLDSLFGMKGRVITVFDTSIYIFGFGTGWTSIAIQPDGKIITAGLASKLGTDENNFFNDDIVLARFLPDSTPDETFGEHGKVISELGGDEVPNAIALQADGKILIGGVRYSNLMVVRYNTDGSLDTGFGGGSGYVTYPDNATVAYAIVVQPDGKIIAGGSFDLGTYFFMVRYLPDGTLDNSFGNKGIVTTLFNNAGGGKIKSLAIDNGQRIVAAGDAVDGHMGVVRYLPDGSLDKSFDEDGTKVICFPVGNNFTTKVFLPNPDKIVVAGYIIIFNKGADFALAALNSSDGSFDSSFGTNGEVTSDFGYYETTQSAVLQSDGKIVLTSGDYYNPKPLYTLARYYGYPVKVSLFVTIKRFLHNHSISWNGLPADDNIAYYSVEQSSSSTKGFMQVAKVSGRSNLRDYGTTNSSLLNGRNYYRVKAVSTDGTMRYSEVVSADNTANTASVYPNPAKSYVTVQGLPTKEISNISIVDFTGNVRFSATTNSSSCSINTSNLKPGNYYVNIIANGKTETLKFVKE